MTSPKPVRKKVNPFASKKGNGSALNFPPRIEVNDDDPIVELVQGVTEKVDATTELLDSDKALKKQSTLKNFFKTPSVTKTDLNSKTAPSVLLRKPGTKPLAEVRGRPLRISTLTSSYRNQDLAH